MKRFHIFGHNHGLEYPQLRDDITCTFFSPERIVFSREPYEILFQCILKIKRTKKISQVWPKSWVNPFGKSPIY